MTEEKLLSQPETKHISYLRRLEKSVDVLTKIASVSVFAVIGSFCTVLALLPLKKTETVFVSLQNGQQLVRLLPEQIDRSTLEQYVRSTLFEYVEKRETINFVNDGERYTWVQAFTQPQWFKLFAEHMSSANPNSPLVSYAKNELTREVKVLSLEELPETKGIWRAEFVAIDRKSGVAVRNKEFVATFKVSITSTQGKSSQVQINPFGLIVENYAVTAKNHPNDKENFL